MSIVEQLDDHDSVVLKQGGKARVKYTGEVVELGRVSVYGISLVRFCSGGEHLMSNRFLEPVCTIH